MYGGAPLSCACAWIEKMDVNFDLKWGLPMELIDRFFDEGVRRLKGLPRHTRLPLERVYHPRRCAITQDFSGEKLDDVCQVFVVGSLD